MQLLPPDILADVCQLSLPLLITGALAGLALWLFGWRTHRFWVVMGTTVIAGVYGLLEGQVLQTYPVVAGIVLAIAAGVLALSVIRLVAFAVGGAVGFVIMQNAVPSFNQPLVIFVAAGFLGLLLFRWWFMAITSASGAMLLIMTVVGIIQRSGNSNIVSWIGKHGKPVSWIYIGIAVFGLLFQAFWEWRRLRKHGKEVVTEEIEDPARVLLSFPNPLRILWNLRKAA
jgi:hypothetical protein